MSDTSRLLVRRIKDGTVIDHIEAGKALVVLRALSITGKEGNVITVALNVPSSKHGKKDIIKVENRSEEHTSELQSRQYLVCRLLLEKKKNKKIQLTLTCICNTV